ncbi:hypothetical protein [Embleya sp. NPDC020630]|uniref:hypothetical protein n=1 Tax=Embleya sp. NPDC020630 TaxID=3363979 RepID=UPI00379ECE9A
MTFTSMIDTAANVIAGAFLSNAGQDPYREAAVLLADRQMLISPERAASLADMERIATVELLRQELVALGKVADETTDGRQQAGMRLAVRWMSAAMDRLLVSPATPMPPEVARMIREGGERAVAEIAAKAPADVPETVWPAGDLSAAQLGGTACVRCGGAPVVSMPAGRVSGFGQVFACAPACPPAGGAS